MRNLLLVILAIFSLSTQAQEAKRYAIKSGFIKYDLSGSTKGTREVWWDDYGTKTCEVEKSTTTTKMFGIKNTEEKNMCTVIVKDKFWVADYIESTGTSGTLPYYQEAQEFVSDMTEKEQQEFADEVLAQMGGKKVGTESLSGYSCDIIKIMGIKSWIHKGLILKSEGKIMGIETNEMFVDFNPNSNVSASKFTPPSGVDYENISAKQQQQGLGGLMAAFGEMDEMEEMEEDDDVSPVNYDFDEFKEVIENCEIDDYRLVGTNNLDGIYVATFMNGMKIVAVTIQADRNIDEADAEYNSFRPFTQRDKNCRYGELEEEDGTALVVEYPSQHMVLIIAAMPEMSKDEILKIENKLQF